MRTPPLRVLAIVAVFLATAAATAGLLWSLGNPVSAGVTPGMSLSAPPTVDTGEIFTLSISAGPPPSVGLAGYQTEVILPTGLEWLQRPECTDEVVATHSGGSPPVVCLSAAGPSGEVRHVAATGAPPPLPALDTPLTTLLEIDLRCNAPGSHKVALTAAPASAFGAVYFGTDAAAIGVTTTPQDVDVDGDTVADYTEVADGLVVECSGPTLTPTATPMPPDDAPAMSLSAPSTVHTGDTFTLSVGASPPPEGQVGGYQTMVFLPEGLRWKERTACTDEAVATHSGGNPLEICGRNVLSNGEISHFAASTTVPAAQLDTPLDPLLEIDVRCLTPRTFEVLLIPRSEDHISGTAYLSTTGHFYNVASVPRNVDLNGDTVPEYTQVAASLIIECSGPTLTPTVPPPPTATHTPTVPPPPTATDTPTPTPCPPEGCPTDTPVPTRTHTPTATPCPPEGCPTATTTVTPTGTATNTPTPTPCPPEGCPIPTQTPTLTGTPPHIPTHTPTSSAGEKPGMSLSAPPSVDTGEIFTLSISAGPPPNVGVAGYATEVILPTGLEWLQQPDCTDEVVATHSGGSPPVVCLSAAGPNGEVRHVAATGLVPPLPALDTPLTSLLEIDLRCSAPGSHKVALTSAPASAFGAVYFGTDAEAIDVTTAPQDVDVDGDTVADYAEVADGLVIECSGPTLTPTATATPTGTATSTATPTPCLPGGCPTPTITPTFVLLPDSDSPSPTPTSEPGSTTSPPPPETPTETATASPTATLISEIGDPLVVAPRTPTQTGVSGVLAVVGTPGATETALSQALQLPDAGGDGSGGSGPPRVAFIAALLGLGGALLAAAGYRRARASRQARL